MTVYEASNRTGGWLKSEHKDGFVFERGCRGFRYGLIVNCDRLPHDVVLVSSARNGAGLARSRFLWIDLGELGATAVLFSGEA